MSHDHHHMTSAPVTTTHDHSAMTGETIDNQMSHQAKSHQGMSHDGMSGMGGGMMMTFFFGTEGPILFSGWNPKNTPEFIGACVAWFFIALFYELLKAVRTHLYSKTRRAHCLTTSASVAVSGDPLVQREDAKTWFLALTSPGHLIDTLIYMVQFVLAYFLMLAVMTYNAWLFIVITAGAVCGHFLFGWKRAGEPDAGHCF